jgi:hypothetical protein
MKLYLEILDLADNILKKIVQRFYQTRKRGFAAQFGERLKFLSPQPRGRDFRFTPTSSGEFKFKKGEHHDLDNQSMQTFDAGFCLIRFFGHCGL